MSWWQAARSSTAAALVVLALVVLAFFWSSAGSSGPPSPDRLTSNVDRLDELQRSSAALQVSSAEWQHGVIGRERMKSVVGQTLPGTAAVAEPSVLDRLRTQSSAIPSSLVATALSTAQAEASTVLGPSVPPQIRRWEAFISKYANQNGLDPNLVAAIIMTESGGNPNATSPHGAVGLMQVVGGSFDPETNLAQGTRIFAANLRQFDGNVELALAAYNAGANSVTRYQGIPPYLETQNYVFEVLNRYYLYSPS